MIPANLQRPCQTDRKMCIRDRPETILALADRILVMRRGRVTAEFRDTSVAKDQLLAAA